MNPLDSHDWFLIELMNPNPSSSKTKDGPRYRVSFEMEREPWEAFMDAETKGMVLEGQFRVSEAHAAPDKPVPAERPKGGPVSKAAAMMCQDDKANEYARILGFEDFKALIYARCHIQSRAELDHNPNAAIHYSELKGDFIRWAF